MRNHNTSTPPERLSASPSALGRFIGRHILPASTRSPAQWRHGLFEREFFSLIAVLEPPAEMFENIAERYSKYYAEAESGDPLHWFHLTLRPGATEARPTDAEIKPRTVYCYSKKDGEDGKDGTLWCSVCDSEGTIREIEIGKTDIPPHCGIQDSVFLRILRRLENGEKQLSTDIPMLREAIQKKCELQLEPSASVLTENLQKNTALKEKLRQFSATLQKDFPSYDKKSKPFLKQAFQIKATEIYFKQILFPWFRGHFSKEDAAFYIQLFEQHLQHRLQLLKNSNFRSFDALKSSWPTIEEDFSFYFKTVYGKNIDTALQEEIKTQYYQTPNYRKSGATSIEDFFAKKLSERGTSYTKNFKAFVEFNQKIQQKRSRYSPEDLSTSLHAVFRTRFLNLFSLDDKPFEYALNDDESILVFDGPCRQPHSESTVQKETPVEQVEVRLRKFKVTTHDGVKLDTFEVRGTPKKTAIVKPSEETTILRPSKETAIVQPDEQLHIIYFSPNCACAEDCVSEMIRDAWALKCNVIGFNYRGVFGSTGPSPSSEYDLRNDGIAQVQRLLDQGVPPEKIILKGHSLGGAIATSVADYYHRQNPSRKIRLFNDRSFSSIPKIIEVEAKRSLSSSRWLAVLFTPLRKLVTSLLSLLVRYTGWEMNAGKAFESIPADSKEHVFVEAPKKQPGDLVTLQPALDTTPRGEVTPADAREEYDSMIPYDASLDAACKKEKEERQEKKAAFQKVALITLGHILQGFEGTCTEDKRATSPEGARTLSTSPEDRSVPPLKSSLDPRWSWSDPKEWTKSIDFNGVSHYMHPLIEDYKHDYETHLRAAARKIQSKDPNAHCLPLSTTRQSPPLNKDPLDKELQGEKSSDFFYRFAQKTQGEESISCHSPSSSSSTVQTASPLNLSANPSALFAPRSKTATPKHLSTSDFYQRLTELGNQLHTTTVGKKGQRP